MGRLVLARKLGQFVQVGEATIAISKIRKNEVSLRIEAPKHVQILRGEILPHPPKKDKE